MLYQHHTDEIIEIFNQAADGAIHRAVLIDETDYKIHIKINMKKGFSWVDTGMGAIIDINENAVITDQLGNTLANLILTHVDEPKLPLVLHVTYKCRRKQTRTYRTRPNEIRAKIKDFVVYNKNDADNPFSKLCKTCKWSHEGVNIRTGEEFELCTLTLVKVSE